jgi:chaperone modulatory protein CbpM
MTALQYEIILRKKHETIAVPGISLQELSRLCSCRIAVARRLLDIGLLESLTPDGLPTFERGAVIRARKALRLKRDLHLNFDGAALVMELLDRIDELERALIR